MSPNLEPLGHAEMVIYMPDALSVSHPTSML